MMAVHFRLSRGPSICFIMTLILIFINEASPTTDAARVNITAETFYQIITSRTTLGHGEDSSQRERLSDTLIQSPNKSDADNNSSEEHTSNHTSSSISFETERTFFPTETKSQQNSVSTSSGKDAEAASRHFQDASSSHTPLAAGLQDTSSSPSTEVVSKQRSPVSPFSSQDGIVGSIDTTPNPENADVRTQTPTRVLNFSDERVIECLLHDQELSFSADEGILSIEKRKAYNTSVSFTCSLLISVPKTKILHVKIHKLEASCEQNVYISVLDARKYKTLLTAYECSPRARDEVFSLTYKVRIQLAIELDKGSFSVYLSFRAVYPSQRPQLEFSFISEIAGYIQTPGWDEKKQYPPFMDSTVLLQAPENFSIMISFDSVDIVENVICFYDKISLYRGNSSAIESLLLNLCYNKPPDTTLYNYSVLSVRFRSESSRYDETNTGFRIRFSFHENSVSLKKLPGNRWNCSVPHWPEFQWHFPCNLESECLEGEDEDSCPCSSEACGRGHIDIDGRCYTYFNTGKRTSWNDASVECMLRGAQLASLNTLEEWHSVARLLHRYGFSRVYTGFQTTLPSMPHLYENVFQWSDGTMVYSMEVQGKSNKPACGAFHSVWFDTSKERYYMSIVKCYEPSNKHVLCEFPSEIRANMEESNISIQIPSDSLKNISHVICPLGHMTHEFLACDTRSACWSGGYGAKRCLVPLTPLPPSFMCDNDLESIPYTLVCDHRRDCSDGSDESFCVFPTCTVSAPFKCGNQQCIPMEERCDSIQQCLDGDDELQCTPTYTVMNTITAAPPAIISFDGKGNMFIDSLKSLSNHTSPCPESHFQCPDIQYYCLPVFVRCNGVYDCPGKEDEAGCDSYACPGYYRCRGSQICVHPSDVCDGVNHCPQQDDELLCSLACPEGCMCYGLAFFCTHYTDKTNISRLRFLDVPRSNTTFEDVIGGRFLIYLGLAGCNLVDFDLPLLPNLQILNVSNNHLVYLNQTQLKRLGNLQVLSLAGNPLAMPLIVATYDQQMFPTVKALDLSMIHIPTLNVTWLAIFPNVHTLNLTGTGVVEILQGFQLLQNLKILDIRQCPLTTFPKDVFNGLNGLDSIQADNYKMCCPTTLPSGFNTQNCRAPSDEISSCQALLRSDIYRVFLSVFSSLALLGNAASFIYRAFIQPVSNLGFDVFVTHLCMADFLMGVYLAIIGIADRIFMGTYLWNDVSWKNSAACYVAGFLSLLSSEVSAFIICFITLDRFLVLRFPFSDFHFRRKSAQIVSSIAWVVGAVLAGVPLLPMTSHWEFYGQNGICIPLPVTRKTFSGQDYSFGLMIVLNFMLFMLIAFGQLVIYRSIQANSMSGDDKTKKSKDLAIARGLITIAMSDFLCWFPIGLIGLLAASGVPIPGEVNVAMAIFVLPFNSALNPFLYTLNAVLERHRIKREQRMKKVLMSELKAAKMETTTSTVSVGQNKNEVWKTFKTWLTNGTLPWEKVKEQLTLTENRV